MSEVSEKHHAHELIDRLPDSQIATAVRFVEFMLPDLVCRARQRHSDGGSACGVRAEVRGPSPRQVDAQVYDQWLDEVRRHLETADGKPRCEHTTMPYLPAPP
jgi:hypothetical protein